MVLVGDDQGQGGELCHHGLVDLVHAGHVHHGEGLSLPGELLSDTQGLRDKPSVGDDGAIRPVRHEVHLSVFEDVVAPKAGFTFLPVHHRPPVAAHADEVIALRRRRVADDPVRLVRVAGNDRLRAVEASRKADVVDALVRLAVGPHIETHVGDRRLQVGGVDIVYALLVVCLVYSENAEIGEEGEHSRRGEGPRDGGRIVLLDASLEKVIGIGLREVGRLDGACQVTVEDADRPALWDVPVAYVLQGLPEGAAVVDLVRFLVCEWRTGIDPEVLLLPGELERPFPFPHFPVIVELVLEPQDGHGLLVLRLADGAAMVLFLVLHEGDTIAHDRVGYDAYRVVNFARLLQGVVYLLVVMTVYLDDVPSVGEVVLDDVLGHDEVDAAADLELVVIHEHGYVRKTVLDGQAARLGDLSLLLFSVPHENVCVGRTAAHPGGDGETHAHGQALAEIARRPPYERQTLDHVALEGAARLPEERHHLLDGHVAQAGDARVRPRGRVAMAYHDPVGVGPREVGT
ncbi:MAG: hypothetical protein A4E61_01422 [Syntrophorhabdus sp. PtaB.Bin184]|nr:MAG: hypothetical protein A4E61_01422 [Syntrophorhabdus sp. PtaB.Bin184]